MMTMLGGRDGSAAVAMAEANARTNVKSISGRWDFIVSPYEAADRLRPVLYAAIRIAVCHFACDRCWHPSRMRIPRQIQTGDIASLNPRLIACTPTGVQSC